jgi:hypothetical protein
MRGGEKYSEPSFFILVFCGETLRSAAPELL